MASRASLWRLTGEESKRLRALYEKANECGTNAAARRPAAQKAWRALYAEVAALVDKGRARRDIAAVLGVSPQRVGQMYEKANSDG